MSSRLNLPNTSCAHSLASNISPSVAAESAAFKAASAASAASILSLNFLAFIPE